MELINLTGKTVCIRGQDAMAGIPLATFPSQGLITAKREDDTISYIIPEGASKVIRTARANYREVTGLPEPKFNVRLLVTEDVLNAVTGRKDLMAPGGVISENSTFIDCHYFLIK